MLLKLKMVERVLCAAIFTLKGAKPVATSPQVYVIILLGKVKLAIFLCVMNIKIILGMIYIYVNFTFRCGQRN